MSVTSENVIKIDTSTKDLGTIKFYGMGDPLAGDATAGAYFYHYNADPSFFRLFSGRRYWIIDHIDINGTASLSSPYCLIDWWIWGYGNVVHARYCDLNFETTGHSNAGHFYGRDAARILPQRWYPIDLAAALVAATNPVLEVAVYPNTNGQSITVKFSGQICDEAYILKHGLFLPT